MMRLNALALANRLNEGSAVDLGVQTEISADEETGEIAVTFVVFELPPRTLISIDFQGVEQTQNGQEN